MDHPSHSTTTASSASGQTKFDGDLRLIKPWLLMNHKTLTVGTREKNISLNGYRHKYFPGHPVIVGYVLLLGDEECQTRFWVTGDYVDDKVTLTIQNKERDGSAIPIDEKSLQVAMKKAREMTQLDIYKNLEVGDYSWMKLNEEKETMKPELTYLQEWAQRNPERVRDKSSNTYFGHTIRIHVFNTIANARSEERGRFYRAAMMQKQKPGQLAEVYNDCGWTDLAMREDLVEMDSYVQATKYELNLPYEAFGFPKYLGWEK